MKTLRTFARLPAATRTQAVEASVLLLFARTLVACVPMRHWRDRLDTAPAAVTGPDARISDGALHTAGRLCRIVRKVALRAPFRAVCLPQAMAAQWMLRRRGIPSRVVFGTRRRAGSEFEFHAWLRVGPETILGGEDSVSWLPLEAGSSLAKGSVSPEARPALARPRLPAGE